MSIEIRPIHEDEFEQFVWTAETAFGEKIEPRFLESQRAAVEIDRALAAFDRGRMVGTLAVLSLELTLPHGVLMPMGGVTWVGVLPTHRRRGVLTGLLQTAFSEMRRRGELVSGLGSSEAVIYGRFGYGPATFHVKVELDTREAVLHSPPTLTSGSLRQLTESEAREILPHVFDETRRLQAGQVSRSPGWWGEHLFGHEGHEHSSDGPLFHVIVEDGGGTPRSYLSYRVKEGDWSGGLAEEVLTMQDLLSASDEDRAVLWDFALSMDLVRTVTAWNLPLDEPIRWLLTDIRQAKVRQVVDDLWLRLVDVPAALAARPYACEGRLVLSLSDRSLPDSAGTHALDVAGPVRLPDGRDGFRATVQATSEAADLAMDTSALASAYLGGVSFATLATSRRIEELRPGACALADSLFRVERAPFCGTMF